MSPKASYPWFLFFKLARLALITFFPCFFLIVRFVDRSLFFTAASYALLAYVIFLVLVYYAIRPLALILAKIDRFQVEMPFSKTLNILYQKDRWVQLEESLSEIEFQLQKQVIQTKTENEKTGTILESINDNIVAVDAFETILFSNTNFKKNFVLETKDVRLLPKLWHTFTNEEVLEAFQAVIKTGQRIQLKGLSHISPIHPKRYFDLTVTTLKNSEGAITGALGVFYDVTEFKLTEQMRVDFVANVSHEIRTPLTTVKGYAQILQSQKDKVAEDLVPFLDKILTNTDRMISLFSDLLNLSVIESNTIKFSEEISLSSLLSDVSENIVTNYPAKSVKIEKDLRWDLVQGDQRLLEQVFSNLLDNACKYSGEELTIKIASEKLDKNVLVKICDNGPGIGPEHLQRIFERFYRVDASRETSRGTGIGLSIVKHIIAKHGGRIWAESSGAGTTFFVELPLE